MPQSSSTITGDLRLRWETCTILCQWVLSSESRAKCCSHKKIVQSLAAELETISCGKGMVVRRKLPRTW